MSGKQQSVPDPHAHLQSLVALYDVVAVQAGKLRRCLGQAAPPLSADIRRDIRLAQKNLDSLAQALSSLAEACPAGDYANTVPACIEKAAQCLALHLEISYLAATPPGIGIWQRLHGTCQPPGDLPPPAAGRAYLASLLMAAAQPAAFSADQLEIIHDYIRVRCEGLVTLSFEPPAEGKGIFWIDPGRDMPPQALSRRQPPGGNLFYFTCDQAAARAMEDMKILQSSNLSARSWLAEQIWMVGDTGLLERLAREWAQPSRRRYPRRRQAGRIDLCVGFERLWHLLSEGRQAAAGTGEWMVINESPDGCAIMHVDGPAQNLRPGNMAAFRPLRPSLPPEPWQICMIRWVLSENPQHLELGLQVLAPTGLPVRVFQPDKPDTGHTPALLLTAVPPLRPKTSLAVPAGTLPLPLPQKLIALAEQEGLAVHELLAIHREEQGTGIEVFSVEPCEIP